MTLFQRIKKILFALLMIVVAVMLLALPDEDGLDVVLFILMLGFAIKGIKDIIFYFTMARHMVGGKMILFQGVVVLDFAMFTGSLTDVPRIYVMVYLIVPKFPRGWPPFWWRRTGRTASSSIPAPT